MKRWLVLAAVLGLATILSGCLQMHMDTTIRADGSGTLDMTMAMSPSVAQAMKELEELGPMEGMQQQEGPKLSDFDRKKIEKLCKEHDVVLKKYEEKKTGDIPEGIVMALEFKSLDGLNAVLSETMDDSGGMKIFKNPDGNYVLVNVPGEPKADEEEDEEETPEGESSPEEMDPAKMGKAMEIMGKLMGSINELDVSMRITVPGDIVTTNAPAQEGRTSIWTINSENMMTAGESMSSPEIVFSSRGLKFEAPARPE